MAIKLNPSSKIIRRLDLQEYGPAHIKLAQMAKNRMDKYVPLRNGPLRDTARVYTSDCSIRYEQMYAGYQYYGQRKDGSHQVKNYHTPGTGKYWNKKMMSAEGKELERDLEKFIKGF